jgi:hypothetical protein
MIAHVLILWGVLAAAGALAVLVHRTRKSEESLDLGSALSFVGPSYGLLLGLLVVFAVGHYNEVRSEAQREASTLVSLYDAVGVYPAATGDHVRHEVVCYMRSIADKDWPVMEQGSELEAPRTLRYGDQLRAELQNLPTGTSAQSSAYGRANSLIEQAGQSRERLLFLTAPEVPTALWVVIYVGAFLVFLLLALFYESRPVGRTWALGSAIVLMTVVIGTLTTLDQPFGFGAQVHPDQMHHAIQLILTDVTNPAIRGACA